MPEQVFPITRKNLEKQQQRVDTELEGILKGAESLNFFSLVKNIGKGNANMMDSQVQATVEAMRVGLSLYYEMHGTLEQKVQEIPGISGEEKNVFLNAYSSFAAAAYTIHKIQAANQERTNIEMPEKKNDFFNFSLTKDDTFRYAMLRMYNNVNANKGSGIIDGAADFAGYMEGFLDIMRDEAISKKVLFKHELVEVVEKTRFRIAEEYTITGFDASFEEKNKPKVEFARIKPYQVAGNVLAKQEMLRDMDRLALYNALEQKNPIIDVKGLSWTVLYDGFPGTGKSSLFRLGLSRLDERLEQVNTIYKAHNMPTLAWKQLIIDQGIKDKYYGETGQKLLALLGEARKTDGIYIITTDDIDLLVGDRDASNGGADKDILNAIMQFTDGINTVVRGNVQWWAATNDATAMDPALRQRFIARYNVDGPQEWYDFADILYDKLKTGFDLGVVQVPLGEKYTPFSGKETAGKSGKGSKANEDNGHIYQSQAAQALAKKRGSDITMQDIGELCRAMKDKNERFTGRAVQAVSEAINKRINDYEIPETWFTNPDEFILRPYQDRVSMLQGLCKKVDGATIVQEFDRYFASEERYANDRLSADVKKGLHHVQVEAVVMRDAKKAIAAALDDIPAV